MKHYLLLGAMLIASGFFMVLDGGGISASAHEAHNGPSTTAKDAFDSNDTDTMKNFVLHAKTHAEALIKGGEFGNEATQPLYAEMREKGGVWNHESVYIIALTTDGRVVNHGKEGYTETLYGSVLRDLELADDANPGRTVGDLIDQLLGSEDFNMPSCVNYSMGGKEIPSCAVAVRNLRGAPTLVFMAGFDHEKNDQKIKPVECPYTPAVTAQEVEERHTEESLKDFVEGAIIRAEEISAPLLEATGAVRTSSAPPTPEMLARIQEEAEEFVIKLSCMNRGPWKSGSVYLFVMRTDTLVLLNGNNQEFTGTGFREIFDENGTDVGKLILETAGEDGAGGIINYLWDDPTTSEDDVDVLNDCEDGPRTCAPGTTPKVVYVEAVQIGPQVYIFGSGIYTEKDEGCAIAGAGSSLENTAFNLLLIIFSLCIAFYWKSRSRVASR